MCGMLNIDNLGCRECRDCVGNVQKECTNNICGIRSVGGQRRKGSEWWSEEVGVVVAENRALEEWLERRDRVTYDRYQAQRAVVNRQLKLQKE